MITYPYEWCFVQLQQAAIRTLDIMRTALDHGMILKDASAYNIQFRNGQPVLIDTLSFEEYDSTLPWKAYRAFCEHFLYPLLLEHYHGIGCISWLRNYIDGIPADVTASLLPWKSRWNLGVQLHVHLQRKVSEKNRSKEQRGSFNRKKMDLLLEDLRRNILSLKAGYPAQTAWSNYYTSTILSDQYLQDKEHCINQWLKPYKKIRVIDAGANDGHFSILAARMGHEVIAIDNDPVCIQHLIERIAQEKIHGLQTIVTDLSNPSPGLGFAHRERSDLTTRCSGDVLLALALIHHLVIGKLIPLDRLAPYFAELAPVLILEFVPKDDEKVRAMLKSRDDVFTEYDPAHLERIFSAHYSILQKEVIGNSGRILYRMERKASEHVI
jgi:ribosomal protein L11 methylase PrmA